MEYGIEDGGCDVGPTVTGETLEEATSRWNHRVSDPAAMLEKVREHLQNIQREVDGPQIPALGLIRDNATDALALLPPIRISGDASDTPAEPDNRTT